MVVGGTIPIVSDKDFDRLNPILAQNIILFGGKRSNYISRKMSFPFRSLQAHEKTRLRWFWHGVNCNFTGPGVGIVSLGQSHWGLLRWLLGLLFVASKKPLKCFDPTCFTRIVGNTAFQILLWLGKNTKQTGRVISLEGVLAAGYWGDHWEYLPNASASLNGHCNSYHMS